MSSLSTKCKMKNVSLVQIHLSLETQNEAIELKLGKTG